MPVLFAPSVIRTMVLALTGRSLSWFSPSASGGPDGGSVRQQAYVHSLHRGFKQLEVRGERRLQKSPAGKQHQPHQIPVPALDEVAHHPAGHAQAIAGLKISGFHAAGDIEGQHDVPGAEPDLPQVAGSLGSGQRNDGEGERQEPQHWEPPAHSRLETHLCSTEKLEIGQHEMVPRAADGAEPTRAGPAQPAAPAVPAARGQRIASLSSALWHWCQSSNKARLRRRKSRAWVGSGLTRANFTRSASSRICCSRCRRSGSVR